MKLANEDVSMLAFTSEQITAPFLLPEMVLTLSIISMLFMLSSHRTVFMAKYNVPLKFVIFLTNLFFSLLQG
jgi:hypothetical protein